METSLDRGAERDFTLHWVTDMLLAAYLYEEWRISKSIHLKLYRYGQKGGPQVAWLRILAGSGSGGEITQHRATFFPIPVALRPLLYKQGFVTKESSFRNVGTF